MAAKLQISAEEAAMNGAPEGELYEATVMARDKILAPADGPTALMKILAQLKDRKGLDKWHEQFSFGDRARGVIVHSPQLVRSDPAKEVQYCKFS